VQQRQHQLFLQQQMKLQEEMMEQQRKEKQLALEKRKREKWFEFIMSREQQQQLISMSTTGAGPTQTFLGPNQVAMLNINNNQDIAQSEPYKLLPFDNIDDNQERFIKSMPDFKQLHTKLFDKLEIDDLKVKTKEEIVPPLKEEKEEDADDENDDTDDDSDPDNDSKLNLKKQQKLVKKYYSLAQEDVTSLSLDWIGDTMQVNTRELFQFLEILNSF
jgi:hypothetical protein